MEEKPNRSFALESLRSAVSSIEQFFREDPDFVEFSTKVHAFDPVAAPRHETEEIARLSALWFLKTKPFADQLSRAKNEKVRAPLYKRLNAARRLGEASSRFSAAFRDAP